jgi:chromosome segregation ATPase
MTRTTTTLALVLLLGACEEVDDTSASGNADVMAALTDLQERFDALEADHATLQQDYVDLESTIAALPSDDDLDDLEDLVEAQQAEIDALTTSLAEAQEEIDTLSASTPDDDDDDAITRITELETVLEADSNRLDGLETRLADVEDGTVTLGTNLSGLDTRMGGLDARMGSAEQADAALGRTLDDIGTSVADNARDLGRLDGTVSAQGRELGDFGAALDDAMLTDARLEDLIDANTTFRDTHTLSIENLSTYSQDISDLFTRVGGEELGLFAGTSGDVFDLLDVLTVDATTGTLTLVDATLSLTDGSEISADCTSELLIQPEATTCDVDLGGPFRP